MFSDTRGKQFYHKKKLHWERALSNWHKYSFPFTISLEDIKNYLFIIKRLKNKKKILLLGSSPEIREILSKLGLDVIIADFSLEMISGMMRFSRIDKSKEKWVKVDWLELDKSFKNNYFDIILGDLFLRNIDFILQDECLKKISKLLKKGGYLITRIHYVNKEIFKLSSKKIIESIFKEHRYKRVEKKIIEDLITSRLFDKSTDFKNKIVDKKKFADEIRNYKKITKSRKEKLILNNILEKWTPPGNFPQRTWTQRTIQEIDELLSKHFIIRDVKISSDYQDSEFYPIYVVKNSGTN
jgi:ubiquinone/menaquinone biosynthesis C-methylase UbiE